MDLTGLIGAPMSRLAPVLEEGIREQRPAEALGRMGALLVERTLHLLRRASRAEILEECLELGKLLIGPAGTALREAHPEIYGAWFGLSRLLAEAARRSDRAAVDSILRSYKGQAQSVLEALAERGGPMPRSEVRARLGVSESYLSHILRDLDEADLIVRRREEGRDIVLDLGPVGREVVQQSVLPPWLDHVAGVLDRLRSGEGEAPEADRLEAELMDRGAPSRLAARRLAEALSALAPGLPRSTGAAQSPAPASDWNMGLSGLWANRAADLRDRHTRPVADLGVVPAHPG